MQNLIVFSTSHCHLCNLAIAMIEEVHRAIPNVSYHIVDIIDDDQLIQLYGTKIPVIRRTDNHNELSWPFDLQQLFCFIET